MSEKSQRLFTIMSDIGDEKILDAAQPLKKLPRRALYWRRWAVAACLCLSVGLSFYLLPNLVGCGGNAGGSGHQEASTFMSYAGPILPMTLKEDNASITAERELTWDFKPWVPVWYTNEDYLTMEHPEALSPEKRQEILEQYNEWFPDGGHWETEDHVLVKDRYILRNSSTEDQTVSLLYPYISSLEDMPFLRPALTLDGRELPAREYIGSYTGGYTGAWNGDGSDEGSCNLARPDSWQVYDTLLKSGQYRKDAMRPWPDFKNIPAVVYAFIDAYGPEDSEDTPNPSIMVSFAMDYDRTNVQAYDFQGLSQDSESHRMALSFSLPDPGKKSESKFLIVTGDDIQDLNWCARVTGGTDPDTPLLAGRAGVTVERYETDLDEALRGVLTLHRERRQDMQDLPYQSHLPFDTWYGAFCDMTVGRDGLPRTDLERYQGSWLDIALNDTTKVDRVCYLETEITIPAGEKVTLTADFIKEPSFDYACTNSRDKGICGYDMTPALDSDLRCTSQAVTLLDREQVDIVRQNFGFDLENGVCRVELDLGVPHYYLEVSRRPGSYDPAPPK